jgi:hypothetical protein
MPTDYHTPHQGTVAIRNKYAEISGLRAHKHEALDHALVSSAFDPLQDSLLPDDVIAQLQARGCKTAAEAALWRLRDSLDPNHNAKYWNLLISRLPKEVIHKSADLEDYSQEELLERLQAVQAEIVELESAEKNGDSSASEGGSGAGGGGEVERLIQEREGKGT